MHFEDHVALISGPLHFGSEMLRRRRPHRRRHLDGFADILSSHQLVGRHFQMLADHVVERTAQLVPLEPAVVDEIARIATDQILQVGVGIGSSWTHTDIPVADQPIVGMDFVYEPIVDTVEIDSALLVALGQSRKYGDDFDVGDFHISGIPFELAKSQHTIRP